MEHIETLASSPFHCNAVRTYRRQQITRVETCTRRPPSPLTWKLYCLVREACWRRSTCWDPPSLTGPPARSWFFWFLLLLCFVFFCFVLHGLGLAFVLFLFAFLNLLTDLFFSLLFSPFERWEGLHGSHEKFAGHHSPTFKMPSIKIRCNTYVRVCECFFFSIFKVICSLWWMAAFTSESLPKKLQSEMIKQWVYSLYTSGMCYPGQEVTKGFAHKNARSLFLGHQRSSKSTCIISKHPPSRGMFSLLGHGQFLASPTPPLYLKIALKVQPNHSFPGLLLALTLTFCHSTTLFQQQGRTHTHHFGRIGLGECRLFSRVE